MKLLIKNGTLIDPANRAFCRRNLLCENGRVTEITDGIPAADRVIDAEGKYVTPGFIDIHMHEDPMEDGHIYSDSEKSIFHCMLRMGVTTAVGGNCGQSTCHPLTYLDEVERAGAPCNVAMLAGHEYFRTAAGVTNRYAPADAGSCAVMQAEIAKALKGGCVGVSFGLRYVPGLTRAELEACAAPCKGTGKFIAAHIRNDAAGVFDAARELLETGKNTGVPVEVSHIGSMAGFGQMREFLEMVDTYRLNGLDVSCDCYPYYAFSTTIGSTTYDDGWLDRYGSGYDVLEMCEGKYKGQRCTAETFAEIRRDMPECMTVCYVMRTDDIDMAFNHPAVMLASDGIFSHGQGHPRAAGAFPALLARFAKAGKIGWYDAVNKMTAMPAARLGLTSKGRLNAGADADITVFDPARILDHATFSEPALAPEGIDYVILGGEIAAENGCILNDGLGRPVRK